MQKKYVWAVLVLALLLFGANATAQQVLGNGVPEFSLNASAGGGGTIGTAWNMQTNASILTWQISFSSAPASDTVLLEGSLNNSNWFTLDTSTNVNGEVRTTNTAAPFIRCNLSAKSGGGTTTCMVINKYITLASGLPLLSVPDATHPINAQFNANTNQQVLFWNNNAGASASQEIVSKSDTAAAAISTQGINYTVDPTIAQRAELYTNVGGGSINTVGWDIISCANGSPTGCFTRFILNGTGSGTSTKMRMDASSLSLQNGLNLGFAAGVGANDLRLSRFAANQLIVDNGAGTAGVGVDIATDGILKIQSRAFGGAVTGQVNVGTVQANLQYSLSNAIFANVNITPSGFGTSPAVTTHNGTAAFFVNVGTGGTATSGVLTFSSSSANGYIVKCDDITTQSLQVYSTRQIASTTTTATIANFRPDTGAQAAWGSGDVLACLAIMN